MQFQTNSNFVILLCIIKGRSYANIKFLQSFFLRICHQVILRTKRMKMEEEIENIF